MIIVRNTICPNCGSDRVVNNDWDTNLSQNNVKIKYERACEDCLIEFKDIYEEYTKDGIRAW